MSTAIGGYFELELPRTQSTIHQSALKFQSARSAFYALLLKRKPSRVWMPHYICEAMLTPVKAAKIEICFYSINYDLSIADDITLHSDDILLYVNYFGVCSKLVSKILEDFNPSQIVFDFSQAFYAEPLDCLATIYSPRKFFGLPDGGLLYTDLSIDIPEAIDESSEKRMSHLIARLSGSAESGYISYQSSELTLDDIEPKRMSLLTERIFDSIDFEAARTQRNKNFERLHDDLHSANRLKFNLSNIDGPLCYPYISTNHSLRYKLISEKVFIPTYWPDILERSNVPMIDQLLVRDIYPLPCDHRYAEADMLFIKKLVI